MIFFTFNLRYRQTLDPNTRFKRSDNITRDKITEGPFEQNVFYEEMFDIQTTTESNFVDDSTEPNFQEIPKPNPRYGHAACKYQGSGFSELNLSCS